MDRGSKRRGRPLPGAHDDTNIKPILFNLEEALAVESLYRPNLLVIQNDIRPGEVTLKARDNAVRLLRFMKVWFDVPERAFFISVTYLDLFLQRTKVQEKYLKCVAFACFYLVTVTERLSLSILDIMSIAQNNFGKDDLNRMSGIIQTKLGLQGSSTEITTCADILKIYLQYFRCTTPTFMERLNEDHLMKKLEVLMTDSNCAFFRPSALVFTLLRLEVDKNFSHTINNRSTSHLEDILSFVSALKELQKKSKLRTPELVKCSQLASKVLKQYGKPHPNTAHIRWTCIPDQYRMGPFSSNLGSIEEKTSEPVKERNVYLCQTNMYHT
ncbi:cyclin-I-like [Diorhabda sublineata]|uniref:cyclin-I-like n=1 Tax=Diorhabda sublineata TaxID=1163346 RepID=UPI0024E16739|nr:cyclin-I-like [Diorhabda sublineata]